MSKYLVIFIFFLGIAISSVQAQSSCIYRSYGDANCDNKLTDIDESAWKTEFLNPPATKTADFNADGKVTVADWEILIRARLRGLPSISGQPTQQPITVAPSATSQPPTQQPGTISPTRILTTRPIDPEFSPTTTKAPTQAVATAFPTSPSSAQYPAQILNLTNWKLTLPIGQPEKPTEIKQDSSPSLAQYSIDPWFIVNPAGGVRFRAPVNGVSTSGSDYIRSELREMKNNGKDGADWASDDGVTHTMIIDQAVTRLPEAKPHVVLGQIHDDKDDVIVFRLEGKKLFIDLNGDDGPVLNANYTLGTRITTKFVVRNNTVEVYYAEGSTTNPPHVYTYTRSRFQKSYFKAGVYTQSACKGEGKGIETNCSDSNYGEVVIYNLQVTHQ